MYKILNVKVVLPVVMFVIALAILLTTLDIGGGRVYVVRSGSMEPAIHTGGVVYSSKKSTYNAGDVITFKIPDSKDTVTHRITEVKKDANNAIFYTVKGDANQSPDPNPIPQVDVVGSVGYSVPYVGYFVEFVRSLQGLILLVVIPATIIIYTEIQNITSNVKKPKYRYGHK